MTKFTDDNTNGAPEEYLAVMNSAYERLMKTADADSEADTHAISDGLCNAWQEGDTVETLVARFSRQHPSL